MSDPYEPEPVPRPTDDPAQPTRQPTVVAKPKNESPKTIIEQVIVALALAFIFRGFVVEAFVIPTGSMATTLLGAHMRFDCPDCGWKFTANYDTGGGATGVPSKAVVPIGGQLVPRLYNIRCPNCAYRLPPVDGPGDKDAVAPTVYHGDRILVLKPLYLLQSPDRWDVVVFKNVNREASGYGNFNRLDPDSTEAFQESYIKRLIGLPGETLVLAGGDVYVAADAANKATGELTPDDFQIARKGDAAQSALWRVVYDDDHRPQGLARNVVFEGRSYDDNAFALPWQAAGGASVVEPGDGGGFAFGPTGGTLTFDPDANARTFALTDYLGYDQTARDQQFRSRSLQDRTFGLRGEFPGRLSNRDRNGVWLLRASDLRLRFAYERGDGDANTPLVATLSKRDQTFTLELRPDSATLVRRSDDGAEEVLADVQREGLLDGVRLVEFANADYRVSLRIDGDLVLETTPEQYAPDLAAIIEEELSGEVEAEPEISLAADGHAATISHLSLWRDVVYTARVQDQRLGTNTFWPYASPDRFPSNVIRLGDEPGEEEYFVLGDNPFLSGDARTWRDPVSLRYEGIDVAEGGRVPARFLVGKAFFVYWPGGFRPAEWLPKIVPNFGEMRFIR